MLTIKKAAIQDCLLINNLASQTWESTYGTILTQEQLNYMFEMMYAPENIEKQMTELKHCFFIILLDEEPCGYISIEQKEEARFNFQKIYLTPAAQGTGAGRYMIEQGIAYVKKLHPAPCKIELFVNRSNKAVGFYKHMGFRVIDTRDHAIGNGYYMNDYVMERDV